MMQQLNESVIGYNYCTDVKITSSNVWLYGHMISPKQAFDVSPMNLSIPANNKS